ncbi:MAG: hypothetical protein ACD_39C01983G0003, partial [uncultured bacterium]
LAELDRNESQSSRILLIIRDFIPAADWHSALKQPQSMGKRIIASISQPARTQVPEQI